MYNFIDQFFTVEIAIIALIGLATFGTIITVVGPLLAGSKLNARMKSVSTERDVLRKARLDELNASNVNLRHGIQGPVKVIVEKLHLDKALDPEKTRNKLKTAGLRGPGPLMMFMFFQIVMPVVVGIGAMLYLTYVNDHGHEPAMRIGLSIGAALAGYYLPTLFVHNIVQKRKDSIRKAWPDALDLLLICVQSGMSIEAAFKLVSSEIGTQSVPLAEELTLTTAEMSYLQERRQAYENLGIRTGIEGVKSVTTSLMQAERYGTPLSQALRVLAQENRDMRMAEAERKAAALPPKLTVPMITFFLPVLFVVILGPAIIQALATLK
ncbi:MAG: type II secretion system F family protein [bacterium]|nr:type II secretion system F family protein [bacterium]